MSQSKNRPKQQEDKTNENLSNGEKTQVTDASEDRKLQIKLAQLNANLQVYLAMIFGAIAATIALLVFGYQLVLESYPQLSIKTAVATAFFAVAGCTIYAAYVTLPKLKACLDEFKNLQ